MDELRRRAQGSDPDLEVPVGLPAIARLRPRVRRRVTVTRITRIARVICIGGVGFTVVLGGRVRSIRHAARRRPLETRDGVVEVLPRRALGENARSAPARARYRRRVLRMCAPGQACDIAGCSRPDGGLDAAPDAACGAVGCPCPPCTTYGNTEIPLCDCTAG